MTWVSGIKIKYKNGRISIRGSGHATPKPGILAFKDEGVWDMTGAGRTFDLLLKQVTKPSWEVPSQYLQERRTLPPEDKGHRGEAEQQMLLSFPLFTTFSWPLPYHIFHDFPFFIKANIALTGWLSWLECRFEVADSIPGRGICLGCRFDSRLGCVWEVTNQCFSHGCFSLSPSPSFSLKKNQ